MINDSKPYLSKINTFLESPTATKVFFWAILAIGLFVRCYGLGQFPSGLNQDEAFAGYEAYSLMKYGIDTAGYHNPVYLVTWGSGMSVLQTYMMIPFIKIFGLTTFAIRIPQMIWGVLSLYFIYALTKKIYNTKAGLCAMGLLAICPWHILMNRWALDCNFAPAMLLIATYFFVLGIDNNKFFMLSALFYGLTLYSYATVWSILPFILLLEIVYLLINKKAKINRYTILSVVILALMALPLLLFVLVNTGVIGEIKTPVISIPKLLYFRAGEVSFEGFFGKAKRLFEILIFQSDDLPWNYVKDFGFLGYVTLLLSIAGIVVVIADIVRASKGKKEFCPQVIIIINFIIPLFFGCLINANINRINILFIPMVLLAGIAFARIKNKLITAGFVLYFALFLISFERVYYTTYNDNISFHFGAGLKDALDLADSHGETVYLSSDIHHPKVLFYERIPVTEFRDTVKYNNYPAAFLTTDSFTHYSYVFDQNNPDDSGAYIIGNNSDMTAFTDNGFKITEFGRYKVAYK